MPPSKRRSTSCTWSIRRVWAVLYDSSNLIRRCNRTIKRSVIYPLPSSAISRRVPNTTKPTATRRLSHRHILHQKKKITSPTSQNEPHPGRASGTGNRRRKMDRIEAPTHSIASIAPLPTPLDLNQPAASTHQTQFSRTEQNRTVERRTRWLNHHIPSASGCSSTVSFSFAFSLHLQPSPSPSWFALSAGESAEQAAHAATSLWVQWLRIHKH